MDAPPDPFVRAGALPPTRFVALDAGYLDAALMGRGLPIGGIVEVSGEAGSGKTQLAMQVAVRACMGGGNALILNTEGTYPAQRIREIARVLTPSKELADALCVAVKVADLSDIAALEAYCQNLPSLIRSSDLRVVVIDSVAAPLRAELGGRDEAPERARVLFGVAASLLAANAATGCGVLVVNQVTDVVDDSFAEAASALEVVPRRVAARSNGRWVRPALGPTWDACVTHRLLLTYSRGADTGVTDRRLYVITSPLLPPVGVAVAISNRGLTGVSAPFPITTL